MDFTSLLQGGGRIPHWITIARAAASLWLNFVHGTKQYVHKRPLCEISTGLIHVPALPLNVSTALMCYALYSPTPNGICLL